MKDLERRAWPVRWAVILVATLLGSGTARAAEREGYTYLSYVGTEVSLVSEGETDDTARINMPVVVGDRISTGAGSRVEAIFADGNILRGDGRTELRFDRLARTFESEDERDLLYLERGTVAIESRTTTTRERALRVDTNDATIVLPDQGFVRIDAGRRGTEVYVLSGRAEVSGRSGRASVRAGEYAFLSGSDEIDIEEADFPRDAFTQFCESRRVRRQVETRYLSAEYDYDYDGAGFEDNGSWVFVSSLGQRCWRPRVTADWRPYSQGFWRWTPGGLTWVSYEPWGWLPYHYGSWNFDNAVGWCWLPGTAYSPAWVYWNYTPTHVGWCPVGFYGGWYRGGYYDTYYRSARTHYGREDGPMFPHLAGRVDPTKVDPRGWNYVGIGRFGSRLDPRDIVRGEQVRFRPGDASVIATAPLHIERGSHATVVGAVQEAVRRVPVGSVPVSQGLTAIVRRDRMLDPNGQDELRRSIGRPGQPPAYHSLPPDAVAGGRQLEPGSSSGSTTGATNRTVPRAVVPASPGVTREGPMRRDPRDSGRGDATVERGSVAPIPRRETTPAPVEPVPPAEVGGRRHPGSSGPTDDGWRAQSAPPPRVIESRPADRAAPRGDDGWRAPRSDAGRAQAPAPKSEPPHVEPRHDSPPPRYERPEPRHEAPPARSYQPPPAPREAPRHEAPPPRSHDAPPPPSRGESRGQRS
jgi:hypothetical protein